MLVGLRVRVQKGGGVNTLFWYDKWFGSVQFCVRFQRLFELAENKSITVANLFTLGVEQGGCVVVEV